MEGIHCISAGGVKYEEPTEWELEIIPENQQVLNMMEANPAPERNLEAEREKGDLDKLRANRMISMFGPRSVLLRGYSYDKFERWDDCSEESNMRSAWAMIIGSGTLNENKEAEEEMKALGRKRWDDMTIDEKYPGVKRDDWIPKPAIKKHMPGAGPPLPPSICANDDGDEREALIAV